MQKTTTLLKMKLFFRTMLPFIILLATISGKINAQPYINGNLSTGTTATGGATAPTGYTWSEVQAGNNSAGFGANIAANFSLADDFIVPAGQGWDITKITFYAYSTGYNGTTSPFNDVRLKIYNTNPSTGSPTPIFGDFTTNIFSASSDALMYRIFNASPATNRKIWKVEANVTKSLGPGHYWIEWMLGNGGLSNFSPSSTVVGTTTQPGNNAMQHELTANTWTNPLVDGANPQDMPFQIDYILTTPPACTPITASVLRANNILFTEGFNGTIPTAGWPTQNNSSPLGATSWFQGGSGVFTPHSGAGFAAANFNNTGTNGTISNWMFSPVINLNNGDQFSFYTRVPTGGGAFPDRLQVRMSTSGASTNVGSTATSTGDFSTLLLDINPTYSTTGYPEVWTKFTVTVSGVPSGGVSGRMAFRYFVEDAGLLGNNSNYIGIDDVEYVGSGSPSICAGATANLAVNITGGVGPYTVVYNANPGGNTTVNNYNNGANIPVSPTVPTTYTLVSVTGFDGCVGTNNSGTATVNINGASTAAVLSQVPSTVCLGSTANLKVDITGTGAPYTVVINATPATPGYPRTITNYNSGDYIPITPTVTTTYNLVSVTSSAGCAGTGNSGTPTVTVSASPVTPIVITADPDGPLCAGDPTLLTVYSAGGATGPGTLYQQTGTAGNGSPSQVFEPANTAFNCQSADDFTVPANTTWTISRVTADGIGTGNPTSINVFVYANSGSNLPGAVVASLPNITTFTRTGGNYVINLPSNIILTAGTYWVSVQVNMSFATGGQWFWGNTGTTNIGNEYAWQNPGGGFGTPCTGWGYGSTGCNVGGGVNRNNIFSVYGTSVTTGAPPVGWTFVWTPAAGLSSTTGSPVAASPMVTTTYTVVGTAPGGCQTSAAKTVVVYQRPAVTANPTDAVACVGANASFTVGASGQGVTYQWQESTDGGTTYNNITNGGIYGGATTATLTLTGVTLSMNDYKYRAVIGGSCPPSVNSTGATLTVNALPVVAITPPVSCGGVAGVYGTLLSVGSAPPPVPGSATASSGTINLAVPDNTANGVNNTLNISGVPANATITNVTVTLNMSHTYPGDMIFNLKAPNGQILNLYKYGSGLFTGSSSGVPTWGWYGAKVSQTGTVAWSTVAAAPYIYNSSTAWKADAINTVVAGPTVQNPAGYVSNASGFGDLYTNGPSANGAWTLAMADGGPGDLGTLASWAITIDYTIPGGGGGPVLSYVWSPLQGLFIDSLATIPYTGTNTSQVYAAPAAQTVYTVTATNEATGCTNTATALVNYTPPAPTVTPASVTMCLGDSAVRLTSASSSTTKVSFSSGTISVAIPEGTFPNPPAGAGASTIPVSGIPSGATISRVDVKLNITHAYVGDVIAVLKAPNGQVFNLDALLSATNNPGANFVNTVISSAGTTPLSSGTGPFTGTFKADAVGATFTAFGFNLQGGPNGYVPTTQSWNDLYSTPNGNWTIAMYDAGAPDQGTLTNWSIDITYVEGVPSTATTWTPIAGLYNDANATSPYAGNPQDTVYTKPTPSGVYNYYATVNNLITANATPTTPMAGGNGNYLVAFNVRNNNAIPVTFSSISSNTWGSGTVTARVFYSTTPIAGNPGPISTANGWNQFGTASNVTVTAGTLNPLISGLTLVIPPGATYGIALDMTGATYPAYTNGSGIVTYSNGGCDIITGGNVGWGGPNAPGTPVNNPRNFNGSITFSGTAAGTCTSPARKVVVTVNDPTTVTTQPENQTICTDKVATFTVKAAGTGPFSYQWQESTDNGNTFNDINDGGVYSGTTTATLTITAPPVTMSGYLYRVIITGAAPCKEATSFVASLTVNPLPVVVIAANPYTRLLPGLTTTITSTVTPNAVAAGGYVWTRNGATVGGSTPSLTVDVDGLGDYQLTVTDVNGCTNSSNIVSILDSVSGKCYIYPNPTSGQFQVRYYSVANNVLPRTLTVYDAKGDRVLTQVYNIGRPYDRMDVDMRKYGKGLYWVEIGDRNGNRLTMCRVVIQ